LTELERQIVEQLGEGWSRWKIAQNLGLGESTVRDVIRRLCKEHDCPQRELPEKLLKEK
jgi:DNA-binding NarL/FixJ family response regulator